jgi:ribosomal protein S18 acetylase RimI-like enzyme
LALRVDWTITSARPADAGELLTLQRAAYVAEAALYLDFSLPPLVETLAEIRAAITSQTVLKAAIGSRIIGAVRGRTDGETCEIGRLAVAPDRQGSGVGTSLVRAIEERFPGVRRFELFTGYRSEANIRLYRRLGYRVVADREHPVLIFLEKLVAVGP